ncbi:YlxQ family RNA-binding protein [Bacillaceae bacterium SIJ1]|uniref:YlxQ family RNA-binding protein n=1 Tax=Litoribacterium kuwaitense TaxID=1398745 RepID=UPI0013EA5BB8|nr:YlxQ family RNA-binding protein [Litoribacterium kuwaitense]NGP44090.1 YlxQ family RNA-binding protein [Litoribacterium kuwaitense]
MNKRIGDLLGLAFRANRCVTGEEQVLSEIKQKRARLVVLSKDTSETTLKRIQDKCNYYSVPIRYVETRYELGHAFGKHERVVAAIIEPGFAEKMLSLFDENNRR